MFDKLSCVSRASVRIQGSKFQNIKQIAGRQPDLFARYDFVWIADDDLILQPLDIARLFQIASDYDFWISQPAFSQEGRISFPVTAWHGSNSSIRIVNFVEVTCPLFKRDKLDEFLAVYDGELIGWGIDWWYCNYFQANRNRKFAVIDEVMVTNPHDHQRPGGQREIVKLQSDRVRRAHWLETARKLHLAEYEVRTAGPDSEGSRPNRHVTGHHGRRRNCRCCSRPPTQGQSCYFRCRRKLGSNHNGICQAVPGRDNTQL